MRTCSTLRFALLLLASWLMIASAAGAELRTVSGAPLSGTPISIDDQQVTLSTAAGEQRTVPLKELLAIDVGQGAAVNPADKPSVWVELTDGSTLVGVDIRVVKSQATLTSMARESVELPVKSLRAVRFSDPAQDTRQWTEVLAGKSVSDLIAVRKKDSLDFLEGVIGDVDADAVRFTLDGDAVPVKRAKVAGLVFARRNSGEAPEPLATVEDSSGMRLQAKSLELKLVAGFAGGKLTVVTVSGATISRPMNQISKIDLSAGKLMFLGDMPIESSDWKAYFDPSKSPPALARFYRPRQNQAQDGQLRLGGTPYAKGLQLYSQSTTVFKIPAKSRVLKAVVGIDDAVRDGGRVRLQIFADEQKLFDEPISGADKPRDLELNLAGARRLKIVVDFGEDQDAADHLDFCDARIMK